jgi:hypothetical protein
MDTDWLSYYFSPLVSMWFGIIWVTMFLGHKWNASAPFMLGKIVASAALLTVFFALNWPLATIFGAANTVFGTEWVAREWAFRVTLDLYIPYVGMLAAFAFIKISEFKLTESPNWPSWVQSATIAAGVVMAGFITLELQVNKFAYNQWHPYTAALPVIAFAILRNATPYLRSTSSRFFMFFGQCSLETFIVQVSERIQLQFNLMSLPSSHSSTFGWQQTRKACSFICQALLSLSVSSTSFCRASSLYGSAKG